MPEISFDIAWPDGTRMQCHSPSTVMRAHLGSAAYTLPDFLDRARAGLRAASDRVLAVHGFPCAQAASQLRAIEVAAETFKDQPSACVTVTIS